MVSIPQGGRKMEYKNCAVEILQHIGGGENVLSAAHCATRMRLVIKDQKLVDKKKLENVEGVKGVFEASGQLQIIIGTGVVNKVFEEFVKEGKIDVATKEEVKQVATSKQKLFFRVIKTLGDVFVPIIPAIVACGILMGILEGLPQIPALSGLPNSNFYKLLSYISNAAFTCLPILIAVSASKVFKCNTLLAATLGIIMTHPSLLNAWGASSFPDDAILYQIGQFKVYLQGYQGHVIPVVLAVWMMSVLERKLHKIVPEMIDLFVTPLVTILITSLVTMLFIGPVFGTAENWVLEACQWFITLPFGMGGLLIGAFYALTVICGIHHMYTVIDTGLLTATGFTTWLPLASCANVSQGAASLAVGIKTKNKKLKSIALPAALSAYLGITEPALFGVNLKYKKPLIAGLIGGAIGCWFAAFLGVKASATGVTGLFGVLITLFSWQNLLLYILAMIISTGVSFAVAFVLYREEEILGENEAAAPLKGKMIKLENVKDETFSKGVLGQGLAIVPSKSLSGWVNVYAPVDGTIETLFETKHAIGMKGNGMEILIHVGINTVALNGEYFESFVTEGDSVVRGQKLLRFNARKIKKLGYDLTTPVVVTNTDEFNDVVHINHTYAHLEEKCLVCSKKNIAV